MAHTSTFDVPFKRRAEKKTNYAKRLALVKSGLPRLVVRKSNRHVFAQLIEFSKNGDKTISSASSKELKKLGWALALKNIPSAYLTGLIVGVKAKKKNVKKAVLDIGFRTPVHGSIPFAALKGAIDAGIELNFNPEALPSPERISGKHISEHSKNSNVLKVFEDVKKKILTGAI